MGSPTSSSSIIALLAALSVAGCMLPTAVGAGSELCSAADMEAAVRSVCSDNRDMAAIVW